METKKRAESKPKKLKRYIRDARKNAKNFNNTSRVRNAGKRIANAGKKSQNIAPNENVQAADQTRRSTKAIVRTGIRAPGKIIRKSKALKDTIRKMRKSKAQNEANRSQATYTRIQTNTDRGSDAAPTYRPEARRTQSSSPVASRNAKGIASDKARGQIQKRDRQSTTTIQKRGRQGGSKSGKLSSRAYGKAVRSRRGVNSSTVAQKAARQRKAFRAKSIKKNVKRMQKISKNVKRGVRTAIRGITAAIRAIKATGLILSIAGSGVAFIVVLFIIIIAVVSSPFSFLFGGNESVDDYPSLAEVASDINEEYTTKFNSIIDSHNYVDEIIIDGYETDSADYVASNWKDILSVWSINNDMYQNEQPTDEDLSEIDPDQEVEQDELPYVMTDKNINSLTKLFWKMNDIQYEIQTEEVEVEPSEEPTVKPSPTATLKPSPSASSSIEPTPETKTVKTLIITPISRDYLWGADKYNFDDEQRGLLDELMSDAFQKEWSLLLLGIVGTEMNEAQSELIYSLPSTLGAEIALNASDRLGHPYSQSKRGQGLYVDCSYLARWCYQEAGYNWFTPGTAAEQARWCYNNDYVVNRDELQAGDLLFYSFAKNGRFKNVTHVAIYIGRASDGKEYMIDASSSNGFVIYREVFSDTNLVMCGRPLMYLD